jgi:hypothetical protein
MRNTMPIRWIEQREARQVLTPALFDRPPKARWSSAAGDAVAQILPVLRAWLAARHPIGCSVPHADPRVEPAGRLGVPTRCRGDDEGYSSTW